MAASKTNRMHGAWANFSDLPHYFLSDLLEEIGEGRREEEENQSAFLSVGVLAALTNGGLYTYVG